MAIAYNRRTLSLIGEAVAKVGQRETEESLVERLSAFSSALGGGSGELYCMGFVQELVRSADGRSRSYQSWLYKSASCLEVWQRTPARARLQYGQVTPGCLIIWQHYKNGRASSEGHVGIVVKAKSNWLETVEANTASGLAINRDGYGIYQRVRTLSGSDSMKVKGFLQCWDPSK